MRRFWMSLCAIGLLISSMAGCRCQHTHGVCDCAQDDYCTSRSPWIRNVPPPPPGAPVAPPPQFSEKLPEPR